MENSRNRKGRKEETLRSKRSKERFPEKNLMKKKQTNKIKLLTHLFFFRDEKTFLVISLIIIFATSSISHSKNENNLQPSYELHVNRLLPMLIVSYRHPHRHQFEWQQ